MHVSMDYLHTRLAIGLCSIALGVQATKPLRQTIAAALQKQPIGPHRGTTATVQNTPLAGCCGHTAEHSEDACLSRSTPPIAACR
jgi:hypothetical protein